MKKTITLITVLLLAAVFTGCSSDPQGPVNAVFMEDSTYTPRAGETVRYVDTLRSLSVVPVPVGIGQSSLLKLGEIKGFRFEAVLMSFDFETLSEHAGKTVDTFLIDLPVTAVDTDFHLGISFFELTSPFTEEDTITAVPDHLPSPIEGPNGETVRDLNIDRVEFDLALAIAQDWIDGATEPWENGIVITWAAEPDTAGLIEMKSRNFGSDPPALRVSFTDGTEAVFACDQDYTVTDYTIEGIECAGGAATRVYFEFDLDGVHEDAMVHYSALVLHVDGNEGFGATGGEQLLGFSTDFLYYLYTPDSGDIMDPGFLKGTGVATNAFTPTITDELRIPLGGFTRDVLEGLRVNTGLVLQSNLEHVRYQKAVIFDMAAGDSLRPYIEIIYTLPADFGGER